MPTTTAERSFTIKNLDHAEEKRQLPKTMVEVASMDGFTIMRVRLQPGWSWHECIKPSIGTESCEVDHTTYVISGHMEIKMDDGTTKELKPGDFAIIPSGHNARVIGNEPCVVLDFTGGDAYGRPDR